MAEMHCARCHQFPKAEILPKRYWKEVLPIMGLHYGKIKEGKFFSDFGNKVAKERLLSSGLFPQTDIITDEDWEAIMAYYNDNAPENLPRELKPVFNYNMSQFSKEALPWKSLGDGLTYMNFNDGNYEIGFNSENISQYIKIDKNAKAFEKSELPFPLVDVVKNGNAELLLILGRMINIDAPTGQVLVKNKGVFKFIDNLERPIDLVLEDFDNDGSIDILIAEFGKYLGGINIYKQVADSIKKTTIHPKPGATKFVVKDVNNDGLKDFYALVAQEDESIYLFINEGQLKFSKKRLLQLPPYYGTSYFELLDFDNDGDDDIICSSGDSEDFTSSIKPFHGVRLFENDGKNNYNQVWFHKQEGAYGTVSADFDNDGDIDIASIGYYASTKNKDQESFLYFENVSSSDEKWKFKPFAFKGLTNECYMLIKARDIDNDGDLDILLGSNSGIFLDKKKALKTKEWQTKGGAITILRNNLK